MASWRQAADAISNLLAAQTNAVSGINVQIYIGWPTPQQIAALVRPCPPNGQNSTALISIFPRGASQNTSRYTKDPYAVKRDATEVMTVTHPSNWVATLTGTLQSGDNIFVFINNTAFGVTVGGASTVNGLLDALVAAINASSLGVVVQRVSNSLQTVSGSIFSFSADTYGIGTSYVELLRVTRPMQVTIWAHSEANRTVLEDIVIRTLSSVNFLQYADSSLGRIVYDFDIPFDEWAASGLFKDDIVYEVEYPVFQTSTIAQVATTLLTLTPITAPGAMGVATQIQGGQVVIGVQYQNHDHVWHDIPTGLRPGTNFTLTLTPKLGSELVFLNNIQQHRVGSNPGINEYSISGKVITMGLTVDSTDVLEAHYEI